MTCCCSPGSMRIARWTPIRSTWPASLPRRSAAPEPVIVTADAARLRQVIDNLISNALQHTPAGTPVTVTVAVAVADGAGHGQLTVADAGPGLSAEQASRVFERF